MSTDFASKLAFKFNREFNERLVKTSKYPNLKLKFMVDKVNHFDGEEPRIVEDGKRLTKSASTELLPKSSSIYTIK